MFGINKNKAAAKNQPQSPGWPKRKKPGKFNTPTNRLLLGTAVIGSLVAGKTYQHTGSINPYSHYKKVKERKELMRRVPSERIQEAYLKIRARELRQKQADIRQRQAELRKKLGKNNARY